MNTIPSGINIGAWRLNDERLFTKEQIFRRELTKVVRKVITRCKRQGMVGIGNDCLWQLIVSPMQRECPNAPKGTNCAYVARQTFDEIVTSVPFNRFVYAQKGGSQ